MSSDLASPVTPVNYDAILPSESINLYYHTSDEERCIMFLIDPKVGCTQVTSRMGSTRRFNFRDEVVKRDGVCILTGTSKMNCKATHLVSHSKGDTVSHS